LVYTCRMQLLARIAAILALALSACAPVQPQGPYYWPAAVPGELNPGSGILGPITPNAYGPGIHSDATGRPFQWTTQQGEAVQTPVKPNAYGLGVGMDPYGRPVYANPR
jgi:hypothetical protein